MRNLVIATKNKGKIIEIHHILSSLQFHFLSLLDIGFNKDIDETGNTFEENAILKAKTVGDYCNWITLAEDSGLVVDALDGKPGVMSARYVIGSDGDRCKELLRELGGVKYTNRSARFITVVALYNPSTKQVQTFQGSSEGFITETSKGTNGFGYDPIFFNAELGKTNGEATLEEKNKVSHRYKALLKFMSWSRTNVDWLRQ
jgi:XTP/dITP diphosphohydrolase